MENIGLQWITHLAAGVSVHLLAVAGEAFFQASFLAVVDQASSLAEVDQASYLAEGDRASFLAEGG